MKRFNRIFLVIGLVLLVVLFQFFGIEKTIGYLIEMGWKFPIILGICVINNLFLTLGWMVLINKHIRWTHYFKMFLARTAGDSTSAINSMGAIAGEPLKAMYIRDIIPFRTGLASVVLDRTVHTIANILVIMTGVCVSFFVLNLPLIASITSLLIIFSALGAMFFLLKKQSQGFIGYIVGNFPATVREKLERGNRGEKIAKLDEEIAEIFSSPGNRKRFYLSLVIHYFSTLITQALEIYFIVIFIQPSAGFRLMDSVFVYIFGFVLTSAMFFMPANVGTSEGSYSLALGFLGYDPAIGFSVGIIRRLRSFVWSALGVLILIQAGLWKSKAKTT